MDCGMRSLALVTLVAQHAACHSFDAADADPNGASQGA